MKRTFLILLAALALCAPAMAQAPAETAAPSATASPAPTQSAPTLAPSASAQSVTATPALATASPSPTPAGVLWEGGGLRLLLPQRLSPLDADALEGYAAAAQSDFPGAGETILLAASADFSAAANFSAIDGASDALQAAREAAEGILGSADTVTELTYGENHCAAFACAIGEQTYSLYFFSDGARVIVAGASGLDASEISAMLSSLRL